MKKFVYKEVFENETTHAWYLATRNLMITFFKKYLERDSKILDAGCGTGGTIVFLKEAGFNNVTGIDFSKEAINYCKKRGLNKVIMASISKLPFKKNTFDAILCLDVLYHKGVNLELSIKEFKRVLSKEGLLYIQEPAYNWLKSSHDLAIETGHRFSDYEIKTVLEKNNFKIIKFTHFNFLLFLPIVIKRLAQKFLKPKLIETDIKHLSPAINYIILRILNLEAFLIKRITCPFGLSIICIAKK